MKKIFLVILILAIAVCNKLQNSELQKSFNNFKAAAKDLIENFIENWPEPLPYFQDEQTIISYCQAYGLGELCKAALDQIKQILGL